MITIDGKKAVEKERAKPQKKEKVVDTAKEEEDEEDAK